MTNQVSARRLFGSLHSKLQLEWDSGLAGQDHLIQSSKQQNPAISLIGYLNLIRTHQIQLIGVNELDYLRGLENDTQSQALDQLFGDEVKLIIVSDGQPVPESFKQRADIKGIPLWNSPKTGDEIITNLQYYIGAVLAEKSTLLGVFMEVMGMGVLITGASNIGKSELALELITRGHRLVADDAPEFSKVAPDLILGECSPVLREFLEVRGLGIVNIRSMFGDSAIKSGKYLRLIIHLTSMNDAELSKIDRLQGSLHTQNVLGVDIPTVTLPVAPGRNLAVLVESAARNHMLKQKGYDAAQEFSARQKRIMEQNGQ